MSEKIVLQGITYYVFILSKIQEMSSCHGILSFLSYISLSTDETADESHTLLL